MTPPQAPPTAPTHAATSAPARDPWAALRHPQTLQLRSADVVSAVAAGRSGHFTLARSALPAAASALAQTLRREHPDLQPPHLGVWHHLQTGGVDRKAEMDAALAGRTPLELARARIDLTVLMVMLEGEGGGSTGTEWRYQEQPGVMDSLALPVQRQQRDDLLALLDRTSGKARGASTETAAPELMAAELKAIEAFAAEPVPSNGAPLAQDAALPSPPASTAPTAAPTPATTAATTAAPTAASAHDATTSTPVAAAHAALQGTQALSVAAFRAFMAGVFSAHNTEPCRADASVLKRMDAATLRAALQVTAANLLPGLDARAALLRRLGEALEAQSVLSGGEARPCRLFEAVLSPNPTQQISATQILAPLVLHWAPLWRLGARLQGLPAGDVWPHLWVGAASATGPTQPGGAATVGRDPSTIGFLPFQLPCRWLAYSLVEPLEWAGVKVTGLDDLGALSDDEHAGLLLDLGVIVPRDPRDLYKARKPGDEFVIECRAMTVVLMEELAVSVREELGLDAAQWPLGALIQGASSVLARELAAARRGGAPALRVERLLAPV